MSTQSGHTPQILNQCTMSSVNILEKDSGNLIASKKDQKSVKLIQLFRFADKLDYFLMTVGIICALIAGGSVSIFSLLWGDIIDNFKSKDELVNQTYDTMLKFIYIGLEILVLGAIMIYSWLITGNRQSNQCKKVYLQSLFSQQIGWFETGNQFEISSDFLVNCAAFQSAIGHNIPFIFNVIGIAITGIVIALCKGWLMTIVTFISIPLMILAKYTYSRLLIARQKVEQESYSQAGGRAQEGLFAIKTVKMLNGQQFQYNKYLNSLIKSKKNVNMNTLLFSLSVGSSLFIALCTFAFGLWYGSNCIRNTSSCPENVAKQSYTAGAVFTVYFSISTISFYMSHLPYNIKKLSIGLAAASKIFQIIDRQPKIQNPTSGIKIKEFKGLVKFNNVTFSYPKDPSRKILDRLNLQINKNKIALIGSSGCGKSTIVQLLLRFYDPNEGNITVDGIDLRDIDLQWWREHIVGYVGQEPFLFATTIRENLLFSRPNATQAELEAALKKAEVYDFVKELEKGLDTYTGSGGCQFSGGQKQRIAIARAFLKNPKILILDQATSALDRKTQRSIQKTINKVTQGIISITITHRVKTIQNSDEIFILENGQVKQNGKFLELQTFSGMKIQPQAMQAEQNKEENKQELIVTRFQQKVEDLKKMQNILRRLFQFLQGNYLLAIISLSCAIVISSAFPVATIFLSKLTSEMLIPNNSELETLSNKYSFIVLLIAIAGFLVYLIFINITQRVNVRVATKIRLKTYKKLLKLPIYWHEREQNNVNAVSSKLAVGSYHISEIITTSFFALVNIICCLLTGLIIGFIFEWRTALVQLAFLPIQLATAGFTAKYRNGEVSAQKQQSSLGGKINEAVANIRTVYSLGYQKKLAQKYSEILQKPYKSNIKRAAISGLFYGIGQCLIFISISILYHIGSRFMRDYDLKPQDIFIVIFSNFFATITMGEISTILPNFQKCMQSMKDILIIEDQKDEEQLQTQEKSKMIRDGKIDGDIVLRNVSFKYESRSINLFENLNLTIPYGKKIGFVGVSGCGKSTILSFLLRFYIPQSGEIFLNNINIKDYDIHYLRSQFGVVGQEPVVFDTSFKENITYNMKDVSEKDIINVAKKANALSFIVDPLRMKAPLQEQYQVDEELVKNNKTGMKDFKISIYKSVDFSQFERKVGIKGSSISGGQKQRLAIARALLRKPQILLLDQATSALDSLNEKIVTQCLNSIMEDRTIISIAHRLETLKTYNIINVFDKGTVVQSGTYDQLLQRKGYFYNLEKGYEVL